MKNTMKAIAALIISATMISITACGNTDNTSSAPPKATTTASSTEASATTTTEATLTSQSEETTSLSATTTSSTTSASTSSGKFSTTTKGGSTTKSNSPASNGGTVNNNQNYSHSTSNNGSGNNSYSNDNNNSYQPQQTERPTDSQTERQTTTTAKKTQSPMPTTTTTAMPKFKLTQNDIDRLCRELNAYSRTQSWDFISSIYEECGYSSIEECYETLERNTNLEDNSWGTPDTVSPDTYSSYDELYRKVKGHLDDLYNVIGRDSSHITLYQEWHGDGSAINSGGKPAWEIYLTY
ncbi:hypothetical protein [Ruminococcus bicirculans (ex Wegman et al. 2014)]|uniref:hypothetical protein n=1 Tax=Ruminococcus bicirculans (ex Wegman et al. 2014) TaxID=1160721 RepID=UPI0026574824